MGLEVLYDDSSINVTEEVNHIWSIATSLRGAYSADKYKDVIIPMIIIRRIECALEPTKDAVVALYEMNPQTPVQILESKAGFKFYNTSKYTLKELLNDSANLKVNFESYIDAFSPNIRDIITNLDFKAQIKKMNTEKRLYSVVKKFSELDLDPKTVDGMKMGYMFEDLIRRFSENAEAGDHYTPREVIRLLVNIILAEGCDDLLTEGKEITVLDMACGTGGMLSTTKDFIERLNPNATVRLFGQETNPESYAICLADMMIKGQNAENIRKADTRVEDCFEDQSMRIVIANPPFGTPWGGKDVAAEVQNAVKKEHEDLGFKGRFGAGLPESGDAQLLFMQHAIYKMDDVLGRAAIIENGSPLFSGNTTSGESQIRRWMLENDLIEAIIALPKDLFYNTGIGIYAFILSKNKRPERVGKVQLINAVSFFTKLRKSLGMKRCEISRDDMRRITELYANFEENEYCKIFPNAEFLYREVSVYEPLQRRGSISRESVERLRGSTLFTENAHLFKQSEFDALSEMDPRDAKQEKKYLKYCGGKAFIDEVLSILEKNTSDEVFDDFAKLKIRVSSLISKVQGSSPSRIDAIAMELSVMDKTAVVQKDRAGNISPDKTTKDTELIPMLKDVEEYFKEEVYPHIPDALYVDDEMLGAEFPFVRYFYNYEKPESSDILLKKFLDIEKSLNERIQRL